MKPKGVAMPTKKELMNELFKKLNSTASSNFYNPKNDTIPIDGLVEISHKITNYLNENSKKTEIYQHICSQLGIPPNSDYIGNQGQISAQFIEDVINFLPEKS